MLSASTKPKYLPAALQPGVVVPMTKPRTTVAIPQRTAPKTAAGFKWPAIGIWGGVGAGLTAWGVVGRRPIIFGLGLIGLLGTGINTVRALVSKEAEADVNADWKLLEAVIEAIARKSKIDASTRAAGVNVAQKLGLPLTAKAIANESGLPTTELWQDGKSIRDHFLERLGPKSG